MRFAVRPLVLAVALASPALHADTLRDIYDAALKNDPVIKPYRSFCNLSVLAEISRGCLLADIPAIIGSLDLVLGEIDR